MLKKKKIITVCLKLKINRASYIFVCWIWQFSTRETFVKPKPDHLLLAQNPRRYFITIFHHPDLRPSPRGHCPDCSFFVTINSFSSTSGQTSPLPGRPRARPPPGAHGYETTSKGSTRQEASGVWGAGSSPWEGAPPC